MQRIHRCMKVRSQCGEDQCCIGAKTSPFVINFGCLSNLSLNFEQQNSFSQTTLNLLHICFFIISVLHHHQETNSSLCVIFCNSVGSYNYSIGSILKFLCIIHDRNLSFQINNPSELTLWRFAVVSIDCWRSLWSRK